MKTPQRKEPKKKGLCNGKRHVAKWTGDPDKIPAHIRCSCGQMNAPTGNP